MGRDFSIEFYENQNGVPVVEEELEEIDKRSPLLAALLIAGLKKLEHREYHKSPLCSKLGDGLFELRVGGTDIARAVWFFQHDKRIIVVRCFIKKTQKTPARDLQLAQKRMKDYLLRSG